MDLEVENAWFFDGDDDDDANVIINFSEVNKVALELHAIELKLVVKRSIE